MKRAVIYLHGKGGNAAESEHYRSLFPNAEVIGWDYRSQTPWEAMEEFPAFRKELEREYDSIQLIANSIGAFFALHGLQNAKIEKAYFISPIVNMEKLIGDMLQWAGVTEEELAQRGTVETAYGETLSMEYLTWVREHPISWSIPTAILWGRGDSLQSLETVLTFARETGADVTVMEDGEHWFHTQEQMAFLDDWIGRKQREI